MARSILHTIRSGLASGAVGLLLVFGSTNGASALVSLDGVAAHFLSQLSSAEKDDPVERYAKAAEVHRVIGQLAAPGASWETVDATNRLYGVFQVQPWIIQTYYHGTVSEFLEDRPGQVRTYLRFLRDAIDAELQRQSRSPLADE